MSWNDPQYNSDTSSWHGQDCSMTQILREMSNNQIDMQLIQEDWGTASTEEYAYLKVDAQPAWLRDTRWQFSLDTWLYAHVVIPKQTLEKDNECLKHLGTNSLGDTIFKDPHAKRHRIEVAPIETTEYLNYFPENLRGNWVRRSILYFHQSPILIVEVFMPALFKHLKTAA